MKKFIKEWWVLVVLISLVVCGFYWIFAVMSERDRIREKEMEDDRKKAYIIWSKVNPQYKLTYEEWSILKSGRLLPGQNPYTR